MRTQRSVDHLPAGTKVAITVRGLKAHNEHNAFTKISLLAGVGLVALPIIGVTGGIGVAMGGEAIGFSLAELTVASTLTGTGAGVATANATKIRGHKTTQDNIELVDMVGSVIESKPRWFDERGYDICIQWKAKDSWGDMKTFTSWHNPADLVSVTYNNPA